MKLKYELKKGDIVASMAGHDEGRVYVVVETLLDGYVSLIDGEYRSLKNPKRKKDRHLKYLSNTDLPDKIKITDIKLAIKNYKREVQT